MSNVEFAERFSNKRVKETLGKTSTFKIPCSIFDIQKVDNQSFTQFLILNF